MTKKNKKLFLKLLTYLPYDVRTKFRKNLQDLNDHSISLGVLIDLDHHFVMSAFIWHSSPEGFDYWEKVSDNFKEDYYKAQDEQATDS